MFAKIIKPALKLYTMLMLRAGNCNRDIHIGSYTYISSIFRSSGTISNKLHHISMRLKDHVYI